MERLRLQICTVKCQLCGGEFRRITNTHLWKEHQLTIDDYKKDFPQALIDAVDLPDKRVKHLKGKSYEQIYGEDIAGDLKHLRSKQAIEQMLNPRQIALRKEKMRGRVITESVRKKLSKSRNASHGGNTYRKRALEWYGLECFRCGKTSKHPKDFSVHHKDFQNIGSELGNHSLDNLEVYCRSCHMKLHNEIRKLGRGFAGMPSIEKGVHYILKGLKQELGLDLTDENFKDTPKRVARAYAEIFAGLENSKDQVEEILKSKFLNEGYDEMILCRGIKVYSMCPHHLLPVEYEVSLAYIPSKKGFILGLSKLERIVDVLSRRPVLQEVLTVDIAKALSAIKADGVMVFVTGHHYCMRMRGVRTDAKVITSRAVGAFRDNVATRNEFLSAIS